MPQQEKDDVRYEIYNRFLLYFGASLAAILLIFSILLVPTLILLGFQKNDLENQINIETQRQAAEKIEEQKKFLSESNNLIGLFKDIDGKIKKVTPMLADILDLRGNAIIISDISYSAGKKELAIKGETKTIQNFLNFRASLSGLPYFSEIISPPENLIKLEDVVFNLTAKTY